MVTEARTPSEKRQAYILSLFDDSALSARQTMGKLFKKVLVANRGEIAKRFFLALHEESIPSVAVVTDDEQIADKIRLLRNHGQKTKIEQRPFCHYGVLLCKKFGISQVTGNYKTD